MKIICIGRNYEEHIAELGNKKSSDIVVFMKPKTALAKQSSELFHPFHTIDWQYEAEIVVRICKNGSNVAQKDAHKFYDRYTIGLDMTARDMQQKLKSAGLPWELAKAHDCSATIGKFIHKDKNTDIQSLHFHLTKNGEVVQDGHTSLMIHSVDYLISYISQFFTLNIGDLIFTGTPMGVGSVDPGDVLHGYVENKLLLKSEIL